jgi:protein-disulfide isomerase
MSILGAIWFAGALGPSRREPRRTATLRENVPGICSRFTAGLAVVLYPAYISFAVLKVYCPLCLTADAAVIGLFIVSGAATTFPMTTLPRRFFHDLRTLIVSPQAIAVAVLFVAGRIRRRAVGARQRPAAQAATSEATAQAGAVDRRSEFERWYNAQPRVPLIVPTEGAKVLIVDFSDFQCPYCSQAWITLKPIIDRFNATQPNTVRLVMRDFPLDSKCNSGVQGGGPHPQACEAAVAVRLAPPAKREMFEDYLFHNQPAFSPENIRKWAREIGGVTDFDAKYASTIEAVKGDIAFGHTLQVKATPTMFINGVKVEGVLAPQYLDAAIKLELQRATAQK